ncbi:MAG: tetratricopeptide repeat protein [Bacteroidota bacterium]
MKNLLLLSLLLVQLHGWSQLPMYHDPYRQYKDALELFEKEKYGAAQEKFDEFLMSEGYQYYDNSNELNANARFYQAICAYQLDRFDAENLLSGFVAQFPENTKNLEAAFYLGKLHFEQSRFQKSIKALEMVYTSPRADMDRAGETAFMLGYSHFQLNQPERAKPYLNTAAADTEYGEAAKYYQAIIYYQQEDYYAAYAAFKELQNSPTYGRDTRIYLANTMLLLRKYDELFLLADELDRDPRLKRRDAQVFFIVANASFEQERFAKAGEYFGLYLQNGGKLSRTGYFRYGYSYYDNEEYREAIPMFQKVLTAKDSLTQIASYYLGFCYLVENDKPNARVAFFKAASAQAPYNETIREDALYQYAKLAFETKYYEKSLQAIEILEREYPMAMYQQEIKGLKGEILLYSKNYPRAIEYLESIPLTSPRTREAYQKACFFYGTKLYEKKEFVQAETFFNKSLANAYDRDLALSSQYWLGEARFRQEKYDLAAAAFNSYRTQPRAAKHDQYAMASYGLAWTYFKQKKYTSALSNFEDFIALSGRDTDARYMVDAYLRSGDCLFLKREYTKANTYYQRVADFRYTYVDYAFYQIAEGYYRQANYTASVGTFEKVIANFRRSDLRDDALNRISDIYATWLKDYGKAKLYAKLLVSDYPRSTLAPAAYNRLALAAYYTNDEQAAIGYFKKVLSDYSFDAENSQIALDNLSSLLPGAEFDKVLRDYKAQNPQYNENLAEITFNTGMDRYFDNNFSAASLQFSSYIRDYPKGPRYFEALLYRARCFKELKQLENSLDDYNKVYQATPQNEFTNVALGEAADIKFEQQKYQSALQLFKMLEQSSSTVENQSQAVLGIAKCYQAMGQYEEAEKVLAPLAINEQVDSYTRNKAKLEIGISQYYTNRLNEALLTLREVQLNSTTEFGARAQYMITRILYDQGKYDDSKQAGLFLQNNYPTYNYWKAKAFVVVARSDYSKGDYFQAKGVLESLIAESRFNDITQEAQELLNKIVDEELQSQQQGGK